MKKIVLFLFLLTLFSSNNTCLSQSGWYQLNSPTQKFIYSINFINNLTGFIGCDSGSVYKTTDGGLSWSYVNVQSINPVKAIFFVNEFTGFLGIQHMYSPGKLLKSTNGGVSWTLLNIQTNDVDIFDISFVNPDVGYVCNFSKIFKTTNSGVNWDTTGFIGYGSFYYIIYYSVLFLNANTGFVGGNFQYPHVTYSGIIWKTVNGGQNWEVVNIVSGTEFSDFSFCNMYTGYAVGTGSKVVKTTNMGDNWSSVNLTQYAGLGSIFAVNQDTVFTCGSWGLYYTKNGGQNWSMISIPYEVYSHVLFTDNKTGFVVGSNSQGHGAIYKTTNGGIPIGINPINSQIPSSPSLSQNYPNPFNPVTKIKFNLPSPSKGGVWNNVRIVIYDILGREVETLIPPLGGGQEGLKPGSYEVQWDVSRYASGVYFYKLMTDEFTETKKMVLIK